MPEREQGAVVGLDSQKDLGWVPARSLGNQVREGGIKATRCQGLRSCYRAECRMKYLDLCHVESLRLARYFTDWFLVSAIHSLHQGVD